MRFRTRAGLQDQHNQTRTAKADTPPLVFHTCPRKTKNFISFETPTHLDSHRGQLQTTMGSRYSLVRSGFLKQRVPRSRLNVEFHDEVGDEHESYVEEEVGCKDEEEGGGIILRLGAVLRIRHRQRRSQRNRLIWCRKTKWVRLADSGGRGHNR